LKRAEEINLVNKDFVPEDTGKKKGSRPPNSSVISKEYSSVQGHATT